MKPAHILVHYMLLVGTVAAHHRERPRGHERSTQTSEGTFDFHERWTTSACPRGGDAKITHLRKAAESVLGGNGGGVGQRLLDNVKVDIGAEMSIWVSTILDLSNDAVEKESKQAVHERINGTGRTTTARNVNKAANFGCGRIGNSSSLGPVGLRVGKARAVRQKRVEPVQDAAMGRRCDAVRVILVHKSHIRTRVRKPQKANNTKK